MSPFSLLCSHRAVCFYFLLFSILYIYSSDTLHFLGRKSWDIKSGVLRRWNGLQLYPFIGRIWRKPGKPSKVEKGKFIFLINMKSRLKGSGTLVYMPRAHKRLAEPQGQKEMPKIQCGNSWDLIPSVPYIRRRTSWLFIPQSKGMDRKWRK